MIRVVNSILRELNNVFPSMDIHISNLPIKFKRPCLYLKYIDGDVEQLSRLNRKHNFNFQIVYLGELDINTNVNIEDSFKKLLAIESIFAQQIKLEGEDKYLDIEFIRSGVQEQNLNVSVGLSIQNLYDYKDIEENLDKMLDINLKLKGGV